jgi:hypothetical protein
VSRFAADRFQPDDRRWRREIAIDWINEGTAIGADANRNRKGYRGDANHSFTFNRLHRASAATLSLSRNECDREL